MKLMYITNNPEVAAIAQDAGVEMIWVDLEALGKEKRQANLNTVKSHHTVDDIRRLRPIVNNSKLLVRINPMNVNSKQEIDSVIKAGADIIMLPMWKTVDEVKEFINLVNNRVETILLLETKEAVECLDDVLKVDGIGRIHIGLNDLHLSYKLKFMFELLSNGTVEYICNKIRDTNVPYGFGGVARLNEGVLPANLILSEHFRLNSTSVILSRSFCNTETASISSIKSSFVNGVHEIREFEKLMQGKSKNYFYETRKQLADTVDSIVERM